MKSSLSFDALESWTYKVGDPVMFAFNQAADVNGYNRLATVSKDFGNGTYEIRLDDHSTHRVDFTDIAPLQSRKV